MLNVSQLNDILKEKLLVRMPKEGNYFTPIEGVKTLRCDKNVKPQNCFYRPFITLIVQGFKHAVIGKEKFNYGPNQCLVSGIDVPSSYHITKAFPKKPYLSISVWFDKFIISELLSQISDSDVKGKGLYKGVAVADADEDILNSFLRLVELLEKEDQIPIVAPLIMREIHYRLLISPIGRHVREFYTSGTQSNQIAQAISWFKENYTKNFRVEDIARQVNMSPTTFNRHFKHVTNSSPLQYQKRLRLHEAQRMMLMDNETANNAAYAVGYESPAQFNREYKRLFGAPPRQDVNKQLTAS